MERLMDVTHEVNNEFESLNTRPWISVAITQNAGKALDSGNNTVVFLAITASIKR
jgi:hypothetical protein